MPLGLAKLLKCPWEADATVPKGRDVLSQTKSQKLITVWNTTEAPGSWNFIEVF